MKILLGDNQFFGVNHFDLEKGEKSKLKFDTTKKIKSFINNSLLFLSIIFLRFFKVDNNKFILSQGYIQYHHYYETTY